METDLYICSKPLQYFNIQNIVCKDSPARRILIILGRFVDAQRFYEQVKACNSDWDEVRFVTNMFQVDSYLLFHPVRNLFVEVDNSFMYGLLYKIGRFKQLFVFEEGFGSYRRDRFDQSKGIKRWINRLTGVGEHVGFSTFLSGQYLYLPALYQQQFPGYLKPLYPFSKPFVQKLKEEMPHYLHLSQGCDELTALRNQRIGLYLTNHTINEAMLEALCQAGSQLDLLYVKPHPHIKRLEGLESRGVKVIHSNIMVEFLLILLLDNGNQLTVLHENSTSVIWFQDRITDRNMGEPFEEYSIVASYIKNNNVPNDNIVVKDVEL